ncbi:MAG: hypothetical protein IAE94_16330 [Chthoniobacterales bacterium]|nr:hypothetical protein [Chthoniobacterales bacterium]
MKGLAWLSIVLLLTVGCSKPSAPSAAPPAQSDAGESAVVEKSVGQVPFVGTWSLSDAQGQLFDLVIFPNGQAVSNWTKGPSGARGQRGFWRREGTRLLVVFHDGWTTLLAEAPEGFVHRGFEPGVALDGQSKGESPAKKLEGEEFAGVWCLNKEPDGSYLYVALQSSGRAMSTINGGTEGKWEKTAEGALCIWPDGWNDLIFASSEGFLKRSWVGPAEQNSTPADISPALRVGDARFSITP